MNPKVYLIGLGPGRADSITPRAIKKLKQVDTIIGHRSWIDLIEEIMAGKEFIADAMTPVDRSRLAVDKVLQGKQVAIVSGGDPGIYAIASTFFQYLKQNKMEVPVEVIPGLTMLNVAAAFLGSPVGHDFAVISLADQSTSWQDTKKRIEAATQADFAIVFYNPTGKIGTSRLIEAFNIIRHFRTENTPIGIVTLNDGNDEEVTVSNLGKSSIPKVEPDSLIIVGNSSTFVFNGSMVTPRNYCDGVGY